MKTFRNGTSIKMPIIPGYPAFEKIFQKGRTRNRAPMTNSSDDPTDRSTISSLGSLGYHTLIAYTGRQDGLAPLRELLD
jgi:hypothetical protein